MEDNILKKANECLNCQNKPCIKGCPLNNNIPDFIEAVNQKRYKKAYTILSETTVLPAICGLICPYERQCQGRCIKRYKSKSVRIGDIEAFVGGYALDKNYKMTLKEPINKKVLVIGSGPASLTCAAFLKRNGVDVTIIEKNNHLGGLLTHGIPEFRLPQKTVQKAIAKIINLGIEVILNKELGKDFLLSDVIRKYDAIFIGIGGNLPNKLNIRGEKLEGVYGANEILEFQQQIDFKNKSVAIIGGGDVSVDIARVIKRLGAKKINIIFRKGKNDLHIIPKTMKILEKENIKFIYNRSIIKIIGPNKVKKIKLIKTKVNNSIIENIKDSAYYRNYDIVIKAIGSHPDNNLLNNIGLKLDEKGKILVSKTYQTSKRKVFAGGDVINTIGTVANASKTGRDAAFEIIKFLEKEKKS